MKTKMKTKIVYCTSPYPLAPLAAGVLTGRLPTVFDREKFRSFINTGHSSHYPRGKPVCLGSSPGGERVMAIATGAAALNPDNIVNSFLHMYGVDSKHYSLLEVKCRERFWLLLGRAMLNIPLMNKPGRLVIEWRIKKIYPELVEILCS